MASTRQGEKTTRVGPHWPGGDTPINVGTYTSIKPVVDEGRCVAPCKLVCPADTDIQGFIALVTSGQYGEALRLIKQTNPLPLVIGRVCPAFCEGDCRRKAADESVAINALERFVADYDQSTGSPYVPEVKPATGHKVAVIGGGPAGLSAAYYLAVEGHGVAIFDANPQLGGMLRHGIPEYRLPKALLDKEIATIAGLCSEIHTNVSLGRDLTIEDLKKKGYKAIFISIGAQRDQRMGVEGEDSPGVLSGTKFLWDVSTGEKVNLGQKVVVIGGGNTAVDAARTAMRLGAKEVTILYRRSREEMPAIAEEVEGAESEGVQLHLLAAPVKINVKDGSIDSLECVRMELGEPDSSGRRSPKPIAGSEFTLKADTVITAVGQIIDSSGLPGGIIGSDKYIEVNQETMEASVDGVFAGGDCVSGPATVVEAVAAGRRASASINQYLSGQPVVSLGKLRSYTKGNAEDSVVRSTEEMNPLPRVKMPVLSPAERRSNFNEIKLGFTEEMARSEAERCLRCGACLLCWLFCPDGAISVQGNGKKKLEVNNDLCKACGICVQECPLKAIELLPIE